VSTLRMAVTLSALSALCALQLSACSGCDDSKSKKPEDKPDGSVPNAAVTLTVLAESARSCEVMLSEKAWEVTGVKYSEHITGDWDRSAPRVALAFTRGEDEPLGEALELTLSKKSDGEATDFGAIQTTCFDRQGKAIEGADVRVE
jgi:hypothetical protein